MSQKNSLSYAHPRYQAIYVKKTKLCYNIGKVASLILIKNKNEKQNFIRSSDNNLLFTYSAHFAFCRSDNGKT
jgi:hypothetical protein